MTVDDMKILIGVLFFLFPFCFTIYKYWKTKAIYKFHMFESEEPNTDMIVSYLCAQIHISNIGGRTGVFNGFIAIDDKDEEYYPISTFDIGKEVQLEKMISGVIPIGHLIGITPKKLYMQDGVLKRRKIPNKLLRNTIKGLYEKKQRYEEEGLNIHPTKGVK